MHSRKTFSFLLLAYLVILLTMGQSMHRADFFWISQSQGEVSEASSAPSCCCCKLHVNGTTTNAQEISSRPDDSSSDACAVCEFFDDFNVVIRCSELPRISNPVQTVKCSDMRKNIAMVIPRVARGPPGVIA